MPLSRAQTFRRRRMAVFGGAGVVLLGLAYLPMTLLAPLAPATATAIDFVAPVLEEPALEWPASNAIAIGAVGFDGVLASQGSDEPASIASITKIITVLTVLEAKPLALGEQGPSLTFGPQDVAFYKDYFAVGGSTEPVKAGLSLSQYQVIQTVLISSANNYARSLARWAFGSDAAFVEAAGQWLDRQGLNATTLVEATGIDSGNRSTPADLLELAKMSLAQPVVAEIVAQSTADLPFVGEIKNSNKILGDLGVDGIKTGTLPEAGACLLFSTDFVYDSGVVTVVGVALGGLKHQSQFAEVTSLLSTVRDGFHDTVLAEAGEVFGTFVTPWGESAQAVAAERRTVLTWGPTSIAATVELEGIELASDGDNAGAVVFTVGAENITIPLLVKGELADPGPLWRLGNPFQLVG